MLVVVVDDEREFEIDVAIDVVYLKTSAEALAWFARWWTDNAMRPYGTSPRHIGQLWLDHDLGGEDTTIPLLNFLEVLQHMDDEALPIMNTYVHSQNPVGARNIRDKCLRFLDQTRVALSVLPELKKG